MELVLYTIGNDFSVRTAVFPQYSQLSSLFSCFSQIPVAPAPSHPQLFTAPWAGAVGSLIDSTFFFSTPYYSSTTFNSSFFICFSIQHVIFQKKKLFLLKAIFDENGSFAFEMIVMTRKWLFCRRVKDILQRLPCLVLSMEVAAVAKRWILFWKRKLEKKNLYSHIWWIWFWNNDFERKTAAGFLLSKNGLHVFHYLFAISTIVL